MTTELREKESMTLSKSERTRLRALEAVVDRGVQAFVEVGQALKEIRDSRLYRRTHKRFEDYCDDKWGFERRYANRLIAGAGVVANIASRQPGNGAHGPQNKGDALSAAIIEAAGQEGDIDVPEPLPLPTTERQARELAKVPAAEQADVWEEVVLTEARPTAAAIKGVVERRKSAKAEEPKTPREKVFREDADLPESYNDEEGNPVPESLWPVWRDIGKFMDVVDGVRSGGMLEAARKLYALGDKHGSAEVMNIAVRLEEMHKTAVELAMSAKPSVVRGGNWFTRSEA